MSLPDMKSARSAIRAFLQREREAQTRFLGELVKTPSDNPPGDCAPHAMRAATLLETLGLRVERHPVPDDVVRAHGMISAVNLVVRRRFGEGPTIALNAHGDVVPPGEGWSSDPYGAVIDNGWMSGRGVAVSKSDFATYAFALCALEQSGATLKGAVELHFTYDEEAGGEIGPARLLKERISRPDLAICAGFSYSVVTAHNGCLHLEVEIIGRSAHAAMPFTGIDALEAGNAVLTALYASRTHLATTVSTTPGIGSPQLTIGLIKGGINTNVVPDRVTLRLDRRIIPEEDPQKVEAELHRIIETAVSKHTGASATIKRILLAKPLVPAASSEKLVRRLCAHATEVLGEPVAATGVPLYTDARHYAEAGIPVVLYGAGPHTIEEANAHRANERLPLDDLYAATEVIALTLLDLLAK
jgi:succinyl-diaminopimelate desuccinylase